MAADFPSNLFSYTGSGQVRSAFSAMGGPVAMNIQEKQVPIRFEGPRAVGGPLTDPTASRMLFVIDPPKTAERIKTRGTQLEEAA